MIEFDGYRPGDIGDIGDIVALHARYYAANWDFGVAFETKVAAELSEFLSRIDKGRDLFLVARNDGALVGSVVIDQSGGGPRGAHLRWFIVDDSTRGTGVGGRLLAQAVFFCDRHGYDRIWLTTFAGLDAARALYEKHGFALIEESEVDQWQGGVREQLFERVAGGAAG